MKNRLLTLTAMATSMGVPFDLLRRRYLGVTKRYLSKYKSHQGSQECARRIRQMKNKTHGYK